MMSTWCNPDGLLVHYGARNKGEVLECCSKTGPAAECPTESPVASTNKYQYVEYWNTGEISRGFGPMQVETDSE
jgi:hypothetical protein